jgi:hypothetical protein
VKITVSVAQIVLSASLLASVGTGLVLFVITTSSVVDAHDPFDTVQRSVALVPTGTPVTVVLKEFTLVTVAVPDTTLHTPVPVAGLVAFSVKVPLLHWAMSAPATAALGAASLRIVMSSLVGVHTPLLIVQRRTTSPDPAATPVMVVVAELTLVIVAVPLTTLHVPVVPATAAFAAIVKVALLHWIMSAPARAAFGAALTVIVRFALVPEHPAAEVTITLTASPLASVLVVKVLAAPVWTLEPFTRKL